MYESFSSGSFQRRRSLPVFRFAYALGFPQVEQLGLNFQV